MNEGSAIRRWPRQMRAETAAEYCDEVSVEAFRRSCGKGKLYPAPKKVEGKGDRWLRDDLDAAIDAIFGKGVRKKKRLGVAA